MIGWHSWPLALLIAGGALALTACSSTSTIDHDPPISASHRPSVNSDATASAELCLAAGTWAAATHYKEHLRRPDPLEGKNLQIAQSRANEAVVSFRRLGDRAGLMLAQRLASGVAAYRFALLTGNSIPVAQTEIVAVLADLPTSCVLSSRAVGPS